MWYGFPLFLREQARGGVGYIFILSCVFFCSFVVANAHVATTTLKISICGNGIVDNDEICIGSHVERADYVLHSQKLQECQDDDVTVAANKHIKEGRETRSKEKTVL